MVESTLKANPQHQKTARKQLTLHELLARSSVNYTILSYLTPYKLIAMQIVCKKFYNRFVPMAERLISLEGANHEFGAH